MKYRGVFFTIIGFFCLRFTVYGLQMITLHAIPPIEVIDCKLLTTASSLCSRIARGYQGHRF